MTDYTKLIERLDTELLWTLNYEAQDAIQALQEENALLEGTLESRGRNIAEMQAENERLKRELEIIKLDAKEWYSQADALQAKLDAMGKGEPVIDFTVLHQFASDQAISYNKLCTAVRMCLAAPKALAPLTDEQIYNVFASTVEEAEPFSELVGDPILAEVVEITRVIEAAHGIGGTP